MIRTSPWIAIAAVSMAISSGTYSCGGDSDSRDHSDGQGGTAGTLSILDGGGSGGTDGSAGGPSDSQLGRSCSTDDECGEGLTCATASSGLFGGQGPSQGYCTTNCDEDPGICQDFASDAICVNYGTDAFPASWCVLGCQFGPRGQRQLDPNKCHARDDVACAPLFGDTQVSCVTDDDCETGELCGGTCFAVIPACLPQCNSDADCGDGFCDPGTGLCGAEPTTGSQLGARCTPTEEGLDDECRGRCIGILGDASDEPVTYMCADFCTLGIVPSCGWAGPTSGQRADGACLFSSSVISANGGPANGDRGSCGQLCDCNSNCRNPDLICVSDSYVRTNYRRAGYCTTPSTTDAGVERGIPCDGG